MTDALALVIFPDNNKFDVIGFDKEIKNEKTYLKNINDYLYSDDYLNELLYLREFSKMESFGQFLELEHVNLWGDGWATFVMNLKHGKMLVGLIVILVLGCFIQSMSYSSVVSFVCPMYILLAVGMAYIEIKNSIVVVDIE